MQLGMEGDDGEGGCDVINHCICKRITVRHTHSAIHSQDCFFSQLFFIKSQIKNPADPEFRGIKHVEGRTFQM